MTHHKFSTPFNNILQIKVASSLLDDKRLVGGLELDFDQYIEKKSLLAYFPLHDDDAVESLASRWYKSGHRAPWAHPFDRIKNYFGEKVGLYYRFLAHYTEWLVPASAIGLVVQVVVAGMQDFSCPLVPFYSLFVVIWAVTMTEQWIRVEKMSAMRWGMVGFEKIESDRPQFRGEKMSSLIDGKPEIFFSHKKSRELLTKSFSIIAVMILLVIGTTASIYIIRNAMDRGPKDFANNSATIASILNAVQIAVFNAIFSNLSVKLTDMENQRTNTGYEDSMIAKLFAFQFVNSYSSFFFIAFVAKFLEKSSSDENVDNVGQCGAEDCMQTLGINLLICLVVRLTSGNFQEFILPMIKNACISQMSSSSGGSKAEQEYRRPEYNFIKDSINDYSELLIQFGYSTLFVTALPVSTLLSLINNHFEMRGDADKM